MAIEREAPVLFGLSVSSDDRVTILYTGTGFAALFGREPGDAPRTIVSATPIPYGLRLDVFRNRQGMRSSIWLCG